MKTKVYLRIGKKKTGTIHYRVDFKKNPEAIKPPYGEAMPTICVLLNLEIADNLFEKAQAELDLKIKEAEISSEIKIKTGEELVK